MFRNPYFWGGLVALSILATAVSHWFVGRMRIPAGTRRLLLSVLGALIGALLGIAWTMAVITFNIR